MKLSVLIEELQEMESSGLGDLEVVIGDYHLSTSYVDVTEDPSVVIG